MRFRSVIVVSRAGRVQGRSAARTEALMQTVIELILGFGVWNWFLVALLMFGLDHYSGHSFRLVWSGVSIVV